MPQSRKTPTPDEQPTEVQLDGLADLTDLDDDDGDFDEDDFTDLGDEGPELHLGELTGLDADDDDDLDELSELEPLEDDFSEELVLDDHDLLLDDDDGDAFDLPFEAVVLPWRTTARIDGSEVPCLLDPTRPGSELLGPGRAGEQSVRFEVGTISLDVMVTCTDADEPQLILGRNALAGRIHVSSE